MPRGMWAAVAFLAVGALQYVSGVPWPLALAGALPIALTAALVTGGRTDVRTNLGQSSGMYLLVFAYALFLPPLLGLALPDRLTLGLVVLGVGYAAFLMGVMAGRRGPGGR